MTSTVVLLSMFRAGLRVYHAGDRALAQKIRDKDIIFARGPHGYVPTDETPAKLKRRIDRSDIIQTYLEAQKNFHLVEDLASDNSDRKNHAFDRLTAALEAYDHLQKADSIKSENWPDAFESHQAIAIKQWSGEKPISPGARFALVLVDVAAEFIALHPQKLIRGGEAEQLAAAFAGGIGTLIPNDGNFGRREQLGSRFLGVLFRAGLETAVAKTDLLTSDENRQALIDAFATPIIDAFGKNEDISLADELKWEDILDTISGPAINAALGVIANNQTAFLGSKFANGTFLGEWNAQLIGLIRKDDLLGVFSPEGALSLYQSALTIIGENPGLVIKGSSVSDSFVKDLITEFSGVLTTHTGIIGIGEQPQFGLALAQAAIEAFRGNAAQMLDLGDGAFGTIAANALDNVLLALGSDQDVAKALNASFNKAQLLGLVQGLLAEAATHPKLLGAPDELQAIVASLTHIIASDKQTLLTLDSWQELSVLILREAARNPGRLFGFKTDNPAGEIGSKLVTGILNQAADDLKGNRTSGGVLFGDTLIEAIKFSISTVASNPEAAFMVLGLKQEDDKNLVALLLQQVSGAVKSRDENEQFRWGSKEWLRIYRVLLLRLMKEKDLAKAKKIVTLLESSGTITGPAIDRIEQILSPTP